MKNKKHLLWSIPATLVGVVIVVILAIVVLVATPSVRKKALDKTTEIASRMTGYDIELRRLYLSPFHQQPSALFHDSLVIEIDTLFVGHANQDTLIRLDRLALSTLPLAKNRSLFSIRLRDTIPVFRLALDNAVVHTDSLIEAVRIDANIGQLRVHSPGLVLNQGLFPLHGLHIADADIAVTLNGTPTDTADTNATLMAFDVADGRLDNIRFCLLPLGLDIAAHSLQTTTLVDVGHNLYDVAALYIGPTKVRIGDFHMPVDTLYGDARIDPDEQLITSDGLHLRCDSLEAEADVKKTLFDLEKMQVTFSADAQMKGSTAHAKGLYDIKKEAYDVTAQLNHIDLAPFIDGVTQAYLSGNVQAKGQGLDFKSRRTNSHIQLSLPICVYNEINVSGIRLDATLAQNTVSGNLHLPITYRDSSRSAQLSSNHRFRVAGPLSPLPQVDYHVVMKDIKANVTDKDFAVPSLQLDFVTDTATACDIVADQLAINLNSPNHLSALIKSMNPLLDAIADTTLIPQIISCQNLTLIDTLLALVPPIDANVHLGQHSFLQPFIEQYGLDIETFDISLHSDSVNTRLLTNAAIPAIDHPEDTTALRLPAAEMQLTVENKQSATYIALSSAASLTDGLMSFHGLSTDFSFQMDVRRQERELFGGGVIRLDRLHYDTLDLDNRLINFAIEPSQHYPKGAFMLKANLDDIPLDLADSILRVPDIDLSGYVRAGVAIDGLPTTKDISAQVQPIGVKAFYKPYEVEIGLGRTPITMEHNNILFNGLPVYGVDSTFIALNGGLNLDSSYLDITFASDSFAPVRLVPNGPIPVYGDFAAGIQGQLKGPFSHFDADVNINILPVTNLTYPIDAKNFAQIFPTGKVNAHYADSLDLSGIVYVNKGTVRYSPKAYPMLPFQVDSGSYARLNGSIGATELVISASQAVKADVQSESEQSRRVDFNAGVRVNGPLHSFGINSIEFFLEAPNDEQITQELDSKSEEDRNGLAMILLGTGMYVGESNVATQKEGYAMSSILNSKINAAMANSKMSKVVDIDLSSGEKIHGNNIKTQDLDLTISKSFFKDKLRVSIGTSLTDNPEINKTQGLLSSIRADYKLVPSGNVLAHIFTKKDYDNVLEGELNKSGIGVRAMKNWKRFVKDSLEYTYSIMGDVDVIYRSNNSIGPDGALTLGVRNLMGNNEALSLKLKGAYYWSLNKNFPGDPKNKNTYKLGADLSFVLPYLHWGRDDAPKGSTRYIVGYQYENIAGGYDIHKISGSFTYFIRSGKYITHAFTPFSLSGVKMKAASPDLKEKAAEYPELVAVLVGDELVPAIDYSFTYDNYRSERVVNTFFDWDIKEAGNLINTLYVIGGKKWNDKDKGTFNQFVKTSVELRNKFNITQTICFATRLFAGAILPLGNSEHTPMSEKYHTGGTLSMRFAAPNSYGPGNFYSPKYNQAFFHTGDFKLEANVEFRFPIVWKLRGAVFADVGNVWNWVNTWDAARKVGEEDFSKKFGFTENVEDEFKFKNLGKQLAFGTGLGLRVDIESIVVRLDIGVGLHLPYQTYKYDKEGHVTDEPINKYYNIPSVFEGLRVNFGIGYPF